MKKILLIFIAMFFISNTATAADFRNASWGMTQQQVINSEVKKSARKSKISLSYVGQISGQKCIIYFGFEKNKLIRGLYMFTKMNIPHGQMLQNFSEIDVLLTKKYGEGKNRDTWYNDTYKNRPSMYGTALWLGYLKKITTWEVDGNFIGHMLAKDGEISHVITYESIKSADKSTKQRETEDINQL